MDENIEGFHGLSGQPDVHGDGQRGECDRKRDQRYCESSGQHCLRDLLPGAEGNSGAAGAEDSLFPDSGENRR